MVGMWGSLAVESGPYLTAGKKTGPPPFNHKDLNSGNNYMSLKEDPSSRKDHSPPTCLLPGETLGRAPAEQ